MARDEGLEEVIERELGPRGDLTTKAMFGGLAWLLDGKLLCCARDDGMLVRLGKGKDAWALKLPDIEPMMNGKRRMTGWVWVGPEAYGDDAVRAKLLKAAIEFTESLPEK